MNDTVVEMTPEQQARLEADGWAVTDAAGFLGMTPEEAALMEIRFTLRRALKERRALAGISQKDLAKRLGTKQPRVAAFESGRESVTLDTLIQALFAVGMPPSEIGAVFAREGELAGVGMVPTERAVLSVPPIAAATRSPGIGTSSVRRGRPTSGRRSEGARAVVTRAAA